MALDTKGISRELEGSIIQIVPNEGIEDLFLVEHACIYDCHDECSGLVCKTLDHSTSGEPNTSYWINLADIKSWTLVTKKR
jgi:hypothetical protein